VISNGVGGTEPIRTQGEGHAKYAGFSDLRLSPRHAWRLQALCREVDPEMFFPEAGRPAADGSEAKKICGACDVREACLNWALEKRIDFGIYGGTTGDERRRMRPRTRRRREVMVTPQRNGKPHTAQCCECQTEFQTKNPARLYCSPLCSKRAERRRKKEAES
jgi:WhiB family redox-sensing transcriptional regulator